MTDNISLKRELIMQSFAPLFLILLVKYFDYKLFYLCCSFFQSFWKSPIKIFIRTINHSFFVTLLVEVFCLLWILYSIYSVQKLKKSQQANFISQGESLVNILPMSMDNLDTWRGLIIFGILMTILFSLMWKTNLYYQNPVLIILGYEVFSFEFETTQLVEYRDKECIGITRGMIREEYIIKRQKISDNVFFVYEEIR